MTIVAIVMMIVTLVVVFGGFLVSIIRLQMRSKEQREEDM